MTPARVPPTPFAHARATFLALREDPLLIAMRAGTNICLRKVTGQNIYEKISSHGVEYLCGAPTVLSFIINTKIIRLNKTITKGVNFLKFIFILISLYVKKFRQMPIAGLGEYEFYLSLPQELEI